jgi:chorismate dehydratase
MNRERPAIGAVPYLNARPLVEGLAGERSIDYSEDVPSRLAERLRDGDLDVALVSSVEAARIPGTTILDAPCIASDGDVESVLVFARGVTSGDPRQARSIALDGASRTAAALTRIVYREFFGVAPEFVGAKSGPDPRRESADATLVIGDAALRLAATELPRLDLGRAWSDHTSLPFVWAVWLAREDCDRERIATLLRAAAARGMPRRASHAATAAAAIGIPQEVARRYLETTMRYALGRREREGLERFLALAGFPAT